ncbi:enoyl-CoA hydratase/isomerase family protein [Undibacterium terreum]|uniref:Isohexenylglutaconyl-CoA hydratase n=1 Tax=Undibacterium terreum TaxID=1224302 RepID=A0A916UEG1_9BURK|nr:enoyl-CoA hydratase-related protein [Undibacterium terreum]GGC70006.1 isohexenylglutaconyl-CoA hydratase [Undibacterium terreum]
MTTVTTASYDDLSTVKRRYADGVLTLSLNRPESRNAMSILMVNELLLSLEQAENDGAVRIIVLRGENGHFCSGGDIKDMAAARMQPETAGIDAIAEVNARFGELCLAYARTPLAVIVALEGAVMGGGFGLACIADVALASSSTLFRLPETSIGLVPAQIAPFLVERLGYSEAKRLAVTGGHINAQEALSLRLIHELHVDANALDAAVHANIHKILQCAPHAVAASKALMARARLEAPQALIRDAAAVFSHAARSVEGMEGGMAFLQKRKPSWVAANNEAQ